jgi:hypothetical protein
VINAFRPEVEDTLMPIHDWTRVGAGIFHHFRQRWIGVITDVLNQRLLPTEFYALAEQQGAGFEPDVLTLKSGRRAFDDFVRKAAEFLSHQVHLLILDLQPPIARDPQGIHGAIWDEVAGQEYDRPIDKPLTLASYESAARVRAFFEPVGVGDRLIDMPLYLQPGRHVALPLEETYQLAFESVPKRWRAILEPI